LFDRSSIYETSRGVVEDWSLWLADPGLKPKSRKNVLAAFRGFLRWLHRRGELREFREFPRIKVDERDPRIISIGDQKRVLAAIPETERGIFLALAQLGLRPGEARALTVAGHHDGWITVDKAIKGTTVNAPVRSTKTGLPKRLPLSEELQDGIERHIDRSERLHETSALPEAPHRPTLAPQGVGSRLAARSRGRPPSTHLALRRHEAHLRHGRDPSRRAPVLPMSR
jgi:integrase